MEAGKVGTKKAPHTDDAEKADFHGSEKNLFINPRKSLVSVQIRVHAFFA